MTAALGSPALFLLTFAILGRFTSDPAAAERYMIGMAALAASMTVLQGVLQTFSTERFSGTPYVRFGARGSPWSAYLSRGCLPFLNGMLSVGVSIAFSWVFLGLDVRQTDWLTLACATAGMSFSCTALALFVGNFVLVVRGYLEFAGLFHGALMLLSGAIIPTHLLPVPLGLVGQLLPVTAGLVAFRAAFSGAGLGVVGGALYQELAVGIAYLVTGFITQQLFAHLAKRRGTLEVWTS